MTGHPSDDPLEAWAKRRGLAPMGPHPGDERGAARALLADSLARLGEHSLAQATRLGTNAGEPLVEAALMAIMAAAPRRETGGGNKR